MSLTRAALAATAAGLLALPAAAAPSSGLRYQLKEGLNENAFVQEGPVAAHLLLRSGKTPRILVAFPAGDSGVGLWFKPLDADAAWTLTKPPQPVTRKDSKGRPLHGVVAEATLTAPALTLDKAVLSSVRVLRDYQALGTAPAEVDARPVVAANTVRWSRDRLDGKAGYALDVQVTHGALKGDRLVASADGRIGLRITALSGETPLTPFPAGGLLNARAAADPAARNALRALSFREKFMAGSWRFNTYFGRDTLMSLRLLMPALTPQAVETGLSAVLARLSPTGEVAHEEDIGEFAVLDHMKADGTRSDAPVYDYKMIDSSYLLGPVAGAWLLDDPRAKPRAAPWLAKDGRGKALVANLKLVLRSAEPFAADPKASNLIALKSGVPVGEWRDSNTGLGGGRYPYDVNAILVPAALESAERLYAGGLLSPYVSPEDKALFARAAAMAQVWRAKAPGFFDVRLDHAAAVQAVTEYAAAVGAPPKPALASLGDGGTRFYALSLDAEHRPISVMNSDLGFELLFGAPKDADAMARDVAALMRPFPAGLMTGVGMVVADAAYAPKALQPTFTRAAYHGAVIWSWQQALFAAGLERQLARADITPSARASLKALQATLWAAIQATPQMSNSELWSWSYEDGRYRVAPFGASGADADESNAAQLWSTVYLAVKPRARPLSMDGGSPAPALALDDAWAFARDGAPTDAAGWLSEGSLFALADGVLGVRGGVEELAPSGGGAFLSRVYDRTLIAYHERFRGFATASDTRLPVADGLAIELRLGDSPVAQGRILDFSRRLDLRTGELTRSTRWLAPNGATIDVLARRVVFGGGVLALRLEVRSVDYAGPVSLTSWLRPGGAGAGQSDDPRLGVGHGAQLDTTGVGAHHAQAWLVQHGRAAGVGGAVAQAHRCEGLALKDAGADAHGDAAAAVFQGELAPGGIVALEKAVVYAPFDGPGATGADAALAQARRRSVERAGAGYADSARTAAAGLAPFWRDADLETPGDPGLTRALRFNLMHLRRSAPADGRSGLAAKGLTGEGYEGHAFWDSEAFAAPVLALTAPALAKSDLAFRASTLDHARLHAREMNHPKGALYPWRTIAGDEGSAYFPSGSAQYHINAAIAYAVRLYDRATGDDAFVLGEAAPMVFETARIWLQIGFHDPRMGGAFRICGVTGPDEYSALVDDDHYTNRMAQLHLRYALELAHRAPDAPCAPDADERSAWAAAADAMHMPIDAALRVHPQDAGFLDKPTWRFDPSRRDRPLLLHYHPLTLYRRQVIKQASVVLAHALTEEGSRAQRRRDFDYYEPLTSHDSTLSAASHAVIAADIGRLDEAVHFLRESVFVDLHDLHGNAGHGLHMASMAGGWQALVWGFAGLRIEDGRPAFLPRTAHDLPAYAFSMVWRGARLRVEVDGRATRYRLAADGAALAFSHDGLPLSLEPDETAERPTPRFGSPPTGPVRALVFDLDGVLTDTAKAHYIAWKALADDLAIPFDEAANEALKGVDRKASLELILARGSRAFTDAEKAELAGRKNAHYQTLIAHFTPDDLLPGARAALERARAAGLPMALASASRNGPALLQRLGIARFFDAVIDPATLARGKPDPEIFLAAAAELEVESSACLGIEDSRAGVCGIKAAGMAALGVGDPAVLDEADAVVPDFAVVDWTKPLAGVGADGA